MSIIFCIIPASSFLSDIRLKYLPSKIKYLPFKIKYLPSKIKYLPSKIKFFETVEIKLDSDIQLEY